MPNYERKGANTIVADVQVQFRIENIESEMEDLRPFLK
jgi:hypothetical protein